MRVKNLVGKQVRIAGSNGFFHVIDAIDRSVVCRAQGSGEISIHDISQVYRHGVISVVVGGVINPVLNFWLIRPSVVLYMIAGIITGILGVLFAIIQGYSWPGIIASYVLSGMGAVMVVAMMVSLRLTLRANAERRMFREKEDYYRLYYSR